MSNLCEALLFLEAPLKALPDGLPAHEVWIASRRNGVNGSGTENAPCDGSTAERLDELLGNLPANTTVRLGPGVLKWVS